MILQIANSYSCCSMSVDVGKLKALKKIHLSLKHLQEKKGGSECQHFKVSFLLPQTPNLTNLLSPHQIEEASRHIKNNVYLWLTYSFLMTGCWKPSLSIIFAFVLATPHYLFSFIIGGRFPMFLSSPSLSYKKWLLALLFRDLKPVLLIWPLGTFVIF